MSEVRAGLHYTEEHEWVALQADRRVVRVGITDHAQCALGDIVYVELPSIGTEVVALQPMGTIESVKTVSDLYSPVNGVIIRVNEALAGMPEAVNEDPYEGGWLVDILVRNDAEAALSGLLTAEQYQKRVDLVP
ncbi:glycine cleavage system protein GcvH [Paenibacillus sp. MMS18-CY102]|uniref:glycine cleavage system protein GcvH n=1 Tax=Paenibacillus sp. MMS18-CY102 TaxID=2682849 RepID=UPI00136661E6|nr:glycine cleavage system protein GcvH [Paenibacillus sp. MMS18-CY102]MWC27837.1 glycine cleavage system protein GcvH [Paenibacillus sp. MMS18-CY102]